MKIKLLNVLMFAFLTGCLSNDNLSTGASFSRLKEGVNAKYLSEEPLSEIVDVPVRTEVVKPFEVQTDTDVQIYGVGELLYNFADSQNEYFLRGDDIELFFNTRRSETGFYDDKAYVFSWENGIEVDRKEKGKKNFLKIVNGGAVCYGYKNRDSITQKYFALIKVPFREIGILNPNNGTKIEFNISVGDADDYFVQNNKISWSTSKDMLFEKCKPYGIIELQDRSNLNCDSLKISSLKFTPMTIWSQDSIWANIHSTELKKVVVGDIKDKYDLSSKVKSCWSKDTLYFNVEIQDSQRKRIGAETKRKKRTFADYGWIEDSNHHKVWEMHALDSKYAGGALKNQTVDTIVRLKRGKYYLKYSSDESHAWNDWDDEPPQTTFYGIKIYKSIK